MGREGAENGREWERERSLRRASRKGRHVRLRLENSEIADSPNRPSYHVTGGSISGVLSNRILATRDRYYCSILVGPLSTHFTKHCRREGVMVMLVYLILKVLGYGAFMYCIGFLGEAYQWIDSFILFFTKKWVCRYFYSIFVFIL